MSFLNTQSTIQKLAIAVLLAAHREATEQDAIECDRDAIALDSEECIGITSGFKAAIATES
jgi:hypothetical protein